MFEQQFHLNLLILLFEVNLLSDLFDLLQAKTNKNKIDILYFIIKYIQY
jgi:hypothetical protein